VSAIGGIGTILNVLREVDIRPIRASAETAFTLAFVSRDRAFADYFAALMYRGERALDVPPLRAAVSLPLSEARAAALADVVVLITRDDRGEDSGAEQSFVKTLSSGRESVPVIVCFLTDDNDRQTPPLRGQWLPATLIEAPMRGGTLDEDSATRRIVKAVRSLKAIDDLALARHLPAFRNAVTKALIEEVAYSNATYSLGTGILQVNPLTGLPLNMADMVILTKNQAILSYRIALAMGLESDFKTIMPKLAAVVGGGFLYRQLARSIAGMIPALGILPKVGIAFAGTHATGEAVRQWCMNGEALTPAALSNIYDAALKRGKEIATRLLAQRDATRQPQVKPARRGLLPRPGDKRLGE
jgi:uncharacterized protein (DUF697 family)